MSGSDAAPPEAGGKTTKPKSHRIATTRVQPLTARVVAAMSDVDADAWDAIANPDAARFDPFVSHRFLTALEASGSITVRSGWSPNHILIERGGTLIGAAPCYLKSHSYGEYVFDHGWAEAYQRHGLDYYPKLLSAVPVTPVPGQRLLVAPGEDAGEVRSALLAAAQELCTARGASSFHVNFPNAD